MMSWLTLGKYWPADRDFSNFITILGPEMCQKCNTKFIYASIVLKNRLLLSTDLATSIWWVVPFHHVLDKVNYNSLCLHPDLSYRRKLILICSTYYSWNALHFSTTLLPINLKILFYYLRRLNRYSFSRHFSYFHKFQIQFSNFRCNLFLLCTPTVCSTWIYCKISNLFACVTCFVC